MDPSQWRRRPAVWSALFVVTGALLDEVVRPSWLLYGGACSAALLSCVVRRARLTSRKVILSFLVLLILGGAMTSFRRGQLESDVLHPRFRGERVTLEGRIETEPEERESRVEMMLRTDSIGRGPDMLMSNRRLLIQVRNRSREHVCDSVHIGDRVTVTGILERLPRPRNPGDFDYGRFLALNGVHGLLTVDDSGAVAVRSRSDAFDPATAIALAQKRIYDVFDRYHDSGESSFLKGVVFGYRGDLSTEVKHSFMVTGTMHILAVSGSNVAVVALIFFSLVGFLRVSHRVAILLTLAGIGWYMITTGMGPSVVRATIMASTLLLGKMVDRKSDVVNSLAFAALVMLLWDPMVLFDVGFQLSFAAVLSILLIYPRLEHVLRRFPGWLTRLPIAHSISQVAAVSIAAQIGTLPFSALYFGRVSLIAVLANLIVVPASGLNTLLGFATLAASSISEWMARSYAALNDLLVVLLLDFVEWCSQLPLASAEMPGFGLSSGLIYYACLLFLFNLKRPAVIGRSLIIILIVLNIGQLRELLSYAPPCLSVTVLDVGQGDAILVELPNRKNILVDAGPAAQGPARSAIVGPWLQRRGIEQLEAVILTHSHDDHIGAATDLLERIAVARMYLPDTADASGPLVQVLRCARERNIPLELARAGDCLQFDASTRIFVLNPGESRLSDDPNDRSVVLKIVYGSAAMLLTGDAGIAVEQHLVDASPGFLDCSVLKISHHGASTATSSTFLARVRPRLAAIAVGRNNKFGHPSAATISALAYANAEIVRTDMDGALVLKSDGKGFMLADWRANNSVNW